MRLRSEAARAGAPPPASCGDWRAAEGGQSSTASGQGPSGDDEWWDEYASAAPRKEVHNIKNHHFYSSGAHAGSMATVYMSLECADGTDTGRGGYVASEPYLADEGFDGFRSALRRYVATKQGQKMRKYVPEGVAV